MTISSVKEKINDYHREVTRQNDHTPSSVTEKVASNVKVLPDDEGLHCAKFERLERIVNTETIFAGILADLVEIPLDQFFLLNEFDI